MVSGLGGGLLLGGGGCGTSASNPLCVGGLMTMKMINNTSSTSINGVTLISEVWLPPPPPVVIAIKMSLFFGNSNQLCGCCGCCGFVAFFWSVSNPSVSTPAERTLSTTSTTDLYLARASAFTYT